MYLKALEIQGFKSFADKVRLPFEKPVTAIVGPNGSGKSNISDALSWVMGEQRSRALRGSKMEDVIFGGASGRSQQGFAQVSLVLDNSEGLFPVETDEVMITRRYYRSGESEYFINKKSVRLKDVNELLMDTGLGRDGYSIIGQGRVDEILSAKSEDRREVFEEAAGISKYRYRKEESERKLARTEESLVRIDDKIAELELQVTPLREQSEKAKKYLTLRDELRGLEISLWMESLDKLKVRTGALRERFEQVEAELEAEKAALEQLYADSSEFSEQMRTCDLRAEKVREEIAAVEALVNERDNEAAVLRARVDGNRETIARLNRELEEQADRDVDVQVQLAQRRQRMEEIDARRAALAGTLALRGEENRVLEDNIRVQERELDALAAHIASLDSEAAAAAAKAEAMRLAGRELETRRETARSELQAQQAREAGETEAFREKRTALDSAREQAQSLVNVIRGYEMRRDARRKKAEELGGKKRELELELGKLESRLSLLRDMEKEYEGFSKAVRIVMQESRRGTLKNIHGTVADLVKTEDRYTVAIETALGAAMQSIVVGREEDGKAAIQHLKRTDGGRATFLPLSAIRGNVISEHGALEQPGVEGLALRLVQFDAQYQGIFTNLLGRTVLVDTMDNAIALSRRYAGRFRIVTLDGQVINAGGSMTGGSAARNVGILSRANEIKRIEARMQALMEKRKSFAEELAEAERELSAAMFELEASGTELRKLQDDVLRLEAETKQRQVLLEAIRADVEQKKELVELLASRREENVAEAEAMRAQAESLSQDAAYERAAAETKAAQRAALREQAETLAGALSGIRTEDASLEAERGALQTAILEWERHLSGLAEAKEEKQASIAGLQRQIESLTQEIAEKEQAAADARARAGTGRSKLSEVLNEKLEVEARRTKTEKAAQEKSRSIMDLEREFSQLEGKKNSAELEEKQLVDKLWDTYELSRTAAQRLRLELDSVQAATRRAAELKREIARLGTPNLGAIEEFERVNERYTYLTTQRDDIVKAKRELEQIIRDITEEMKEIFAAEFKLINESFQETFLELFGGGRAELILEDENDILNCGVEIKAQPPGKTFRALSLLSGGERAFVAIALYFAIMKVRPTPFCVLDEIETALDEKNVERFAKYMRRVSDKTQFLAITHRRGTMEEADVLYGVTMQSGVSKVLSIDLEAALKQ